MAFQTRSRDPLFDEATQAILERRAWELAGLALLAVAVVLGLALGSYAPTDPSFLGTSSSAPQNWLGTFGAYVAAPLYVILGAGSWALVATAGAWGLRFVLHRGEERAFGRLVFAPLWVAVASLYAATVPPGPDWTHSFGLGGLFGDTGLGVLLGLVPMSPAYGLIAASAGLALGLLAMGLFVLGATRAETGGALRFLGLGVLFAFDQLVRGAGDRAGRARDGLAARREARRAARAEAALAAPAAATAEPRVARADTGRDLFGEASDDPVFDDDDDFDAPEITLPPEPKLGLIARTLGRPQPRLAAPPASEPFDDIDDEDDLPFDPEGGQDRVRAKITDAIRTRLRTDRARAAETRARREPVLTRPASAPEAAGQAFGPADDAAEADDFAADAAFYDLPEADLPAIDPASDMDMPEEPAPAAIPRAAPKAPVVQHAAVRRPAPSARAQAESQPPLQFTPPAEDDYDPPPLSLLRDPATVERLYLSDEALEENARMLENVLEDYGVKGDIVSVRPGPVVTMYELEPAPGLKASRVIGLADDIARSMSALSARVSTVPGRSVIGIELPNDNREMVLLREILSARDFGDSKLRLPLALGKDIGGESIVANLAKMPHLLIAGTTGSGKSVAINTMILSLLYKLTPDECRLIMIDPKMLELSVYDDIPHLLSPVVTDPKKAVVALKWVVAEMEDRYRKMSKMGVRNIEGYNGKVRATLEKGEMFSRTVQTGFDDETGDPVFETEQFAPETLPYIVVIVDEMADLMMVAGKEIEACIQRLAQMARASGIHLIMATQRPSVDVITGTIKANFPTRISFQVTSKIDSRTILGEQGAEQLLGMGDMLYMAGGGRITRIHAPFVSDEEVEEVVNHLKSYGPPSYVGGVADGPEDDREAEIDAVLGLGGNTGGEDALYDQAVQVVINDRKCSTSYIQRKLAIGYNKAARLVEQMEDAGLVSPANHVGKREVLVPERERD
ncbi:DNA translocase FtsK [Meridianimarinicoccus roseus]|uniref:DNA translocase FtsK n=1 Tax=Meridianimarinicoccus roseus TaxID=2072018 RepID=A0A2V2L9C8_9RHOB|nr:DNA translocase FtsK [Meridianimarinicoccus roseus]PWR01852.1 DNA translocase FtsK [Meridianimarinicoccus roseus]